MYISKYLIRSCVFLFWLNHNCTIKNCVCYWINEISLYIYIYTLLFCLFVCNHQTSKRLNRSGPNFVWNLTWPQGRFMGNQNFKKLASNKIRFSLDFKKSTKFFLNPLTFLFLFYNVYKEKMFTIRRWARSALKG